MEGSSDVLVRVGPLDGVLAILEQRQPRTYKHTSVYTCLHTHKIHTHIYMCDHKEFYLIPALGLVVHACLKHQFSEH